MTGANTVREDGRERDRIIPDNRKVRELPRGAPVLVRGIRAAHPTAIDIGRFRSVGDSGSTVRVAIGHREVDVDVEQVQAVDGLSLTDAQRTALFVVATIGNRTMKADPTLRYGVSASSVAGRCDWRNPRTGKPATRAAVNRLLALRAVGLVTDVDGKWFTTDGGEWLARRLWPDEVRP